ncbi:MAG TPA: ferritin-like domain-containing protein [Byssovorax sp.]|jgi:hypothetical protein
MSDEPLKERRGERAAGDDEAITTDTVKLRTPWQAIVSTVAGLMAAVISGSVLHSCATELRSANSDTSLRNLGLSLVCVVVSLIFGVVGLIRSRNKVGGVAVAATGAVLGLVLSGLSVLMLVASVAYGVLIALGSAGGPGRLFRVRGAPRVAKRARSRAWSSSDALDLDVAALSEEARATLADAWERDALIEHASIAAFSRLSLELMAHGAPPDLLARTHDAALDEIEHAERSFAIASAYAGHAVGAGAFPEATSRGDVRGDLGSMAREAIVDGCVGEGFAAACARASAAATTIPELRAFFQKAADDEARHADLAWDMLSFTIARGGARAANAASRALASLRQPSFDAAAMDLRAHGWLVVAERARLHDAVSADVRARLGAMLAVEADAA